MEWRSFAALKQGRRQVPRIHELERLAAVLGVPSAFVYQVANGAAPDDVAALLAREQALRAELDAERRTLQLLFEHVPAACLVFEPDGTISRAGGPVDKCCPAPAAALVGRKAAEVFGDPGPAGCPVTRAFLTGRTEQQVSRVRDAAGRQVYVHRTAGPIVRDGRVLQVIEVLVDVGEQVRAGDLRVVSLWVDQPADRPGTAPVERRGLPRVDTEFAAEIQAAGRRFDARLIGQDNRVDLALVKVEATGLPVAALGDSNRLRVGEFVLALGHPFGLEQTVSFGIVSRKGAPLQVAAPGFDFIQTDAAVNPGNSGGPLVNMAGEVVGVNSMAARNGSIGFAIPVNLVKGLLPQLAEKGKVEWGWLGVSISELDEDDAPKYGLKEPRGVLIRQVVAGQPADQGGVKADDVVLAVDGTQLEGPRDLQRIISSTPVGRTVTLKVLRAGKEQELSVIVGAYQGPGISRAPRRSPSPPRPHP